MRMFRRSTEDPTAENPFWITYSDLLSSLVMVLLALVFSFTALAANEVQAEKRRADDQRIELAMYDRLRQLQARYDVIQNNIQRLQREFPQIKIDPQTGDIVIKGQILFGVAKYALSDAGRAFLRRFVPRLCDSLFSGDVAGDLIVRIYCEGYADAQGNSPSRPDNYVANMQLSQQRASAVVEFLISRVAPSLSDLARRNRLQHLLTCSGRSDEDSVERLLPTHKDDYALVRTLSDPESRNVTLRIQWKNVFADKDLIPRSSDTRGPLP